MNKDSYNRTIKELIQVISSVNVSATNKGEFFGYFLDRLIHRYIQIQEARGDQFNASLFPAATRKSLDLLASRLASQLGASDPVESANDLYYVVISVIDGMEPTSGMLLFLRGCICKTQTKIQIALDTALGADPKERVMASRRRITALGVLAGALRYNTGVRLTDEACCKALG